MIYSIENENLKIQVNTQGAQLWSVFSKKTGVEYLWQGDPAVWSGRAYNLFPFIGRSYEGVFRYDGKEYPSRSHGLARYFEFTLEAQTENSLTFLFTDSEETKKEYPFSFEFRVIFTLNDNALTTRYVVKNTDERELICAFGGHPGINVPFDGGVFEDYYLEFSKPTAAERELLDKSDRFMADKAVPYALQDGVKLPLKHELFEHDAIILKNTSGEVAIKTPHSKRYVSVVYHDYPFVGFWQMANIRPQYLCVEPWSALPAIDGKIVELESKPHMTRVKPNGESSMRFDVIIHE